MIDRPLEALFILAPDPAGVTPRKKPNVIPIRHEDSIASLVIRHTQGLWATAAVLDPEKYMTICWHVVKNTRMFVVQYERTFEALPVLVESISEAAGRL